MHHLLTLCEIQPVRDMHTLRVVAAVPMWPAGTGLVDGFASMRMLDMLNIALSMLNIASWYQRMVPVHVNRKRAETTACYHVV